MTNPYRSQADYCFWSRSVTWCPPGRLDPVTTATLIGATEKVATLGSCFAQHISRHLKKSGLNYFVAETAPAEMSEKEAASRNYDVFSARYGNVYTVRQALQLLARATGEFQPEEDVWRSGEHFVDPFRPAIEPQGFASAEAVRASARLHLQQVRRLFEETDLVVFTLGLTEAWRSKHDGAVFPLAPGVSGGQFDADIHERVNFSTSEVIDDLKQFIARLTQMNPSVRIILTVSPVPLIATHENRHVVVSTSHSKAVLRAAAGEVEQDFANVYYFPSYEIITSPHSQGRYFKEDLRSVSDVGVSHVMRVFSRHFIGGEAHAQHSASEHPLSGSIVGDQNIVCDEEEIERALRATGFQK